MEELRQGGTLRLQCASRNREVGGKVEAMPKASNCMLFVLSG